jgi:hypothetical protein
VVVAADSGVRAACADRAELGFVRSGGGQGGGGRSHRGFSLELGVVRELRKPGLRGPRDGVPGVGENRAYVWGGAASDTLN